MSNKLPVFENPPLEEMVIGVQFAPLKGFRISHFGLFWSLIRDRYPLTEDETPLAHVLEIAEKRPAKSTIRFEKLPLPRCWYLDSTGSTLLQLQSDHFLRNWRRSAAMEEYPRYVNLIRDFRGELDGFMRFTEVEDIGAVAINQCELTYVNHVEWAEQGDEVDLANVFSPFRSNLETGSFRDMETIEFAMRVKLPENRGRLHISVNPAFRGRDMKLVHVLTMTARGTPSEAGLQQVFDWFDLAHEKILERFEEITSPTMHASWGKKET